MHGDIVMCCHSGSGHTCNGSMCPYLEEKDDAKVCTVSCQSFDLDFRTTYNEGERRFAFRIEKGKFEPVQDTLVCKAPRTSRAPSRQKHMTQTAGSCVDAVIDLARQLAPTLPASSAQSIGILCGGIYEQIRSVPMFRTLGMDYAPRRHAMVCLYRMANTGHTSHGITVLPACSNLRTALVTLDASVHVVGASMRGSFTRMDKLFDLFVHHWLEALPLSQRSAFDTPTMHGVSSHS
jgi:hypothetical protein